jgi:hypothetical protein
MCSAETMASEMYLAGRALPPAPPVLDAAVSAAALLLRNRSHVHCLLLP